MNKVCRKHIAAPALPHRPNPRPSGTAQHDDTYKSFSGLTVIRRSAGAGSFSDAAINSRGTGDCGRAGAGRPRFRSAGPGPRGMGFPPAAGDALTSSSKDNDSKECNTIRDFIR